MSESLQIGLIGFGGAILGALITAFLQPVWSNLVSKRSKLSVTITHHPFRLPAFLKASMQEYRLNYKLNIRPTKETQERLQSISFSSGLTSVSITNKSKRTIQGLVVQLANDTEFVADCIKDGAEPVTSFGRVCHIGNLRAGGACQILLWTPNENTEGYFGSHKTAVRVSADEYDKISTSFPPAGYTSRGYFLLSRHLIWITFWTFIVLFNIILWLAPLVLRGSL